MLGNKQIFVIFLSALSIMLLCVIFVPLGANASLTRPPNVKVYENGNVITNFLAFDESFGGGVQVATGDVDRDGIDEVVVVAGQGGAPHVRILEITGEEISHFYAYDLSMRAGVNIALGDLDGDGIPEIVTAPRYGASPHVRVFDIWGKAKFTPGFFAYDPAFRGGVNIAIGDLHGDGSNEIITAPGPSGGPHVRIFDRSGASLDSFFPFHQSYRGGINVATANVDGGLDDEMIFSVQSSDAPWVKVIKKNGHETLLGHFMAFGESFTGGVTVAGADIDGDQIDEVIVGAQAGGGPQVRIFKGSGDLASSGFFAYEYDFRGGVNVAGGKFSNNKNEQILVGPSSMRITGRMDLPKYVEVNLTEQRLYAYDYGRLMNTFLVSTGLPGMDTRTGTFNISQKIPVKLYSGVDFYLPNTKWNLRFDGSRLLHGAYWHNNFGKRMSHGCVNIAYENAEWLYNWADIGTTVIVHN